MFRKDYVHAYTAADTGVHMQCHDRHNLITISLSSTISDNYLITISLSSTKSDNYLII